MRKFITTAALVAAVAGALAPAASAQVSETKPNPKGTESKSSCYGEFKQSQDKVRRAGLHRLCVIARKALKAHTPAGGEGVSASAPKLASCERLDGYAIATWKCGVASSYPDATNGEGHCVGSIRVWGTNPDWRKLRYRDTLFGCSV
jgi:hypothetical protein